MSNDDLRNVFKFLAQRRRLRKLQAAKPWWRRLLEWLRYR